MSVNDILNERKQLKAHIWHFTMWPKRWISYNLSDQFNWEIHPFQQDQKDNIPNQPGIYSFVIQPGIATYPHSTYLMYIGSTMRTLQGRFEEYFDEQNKPTGRPLILDCLNDYQGYIHFCCSVIGQKERIDEIEKALIKAFLPPCNDQFPAGVRKTSKAF
ncbi:MAG: GIY-YIG nuclease family protein [Candidatus Poribacteria bacterium]|nr:GIY-YIG nuclease family protein [Candidatus Poribacteria bacterium]